MENRSCIQQSLDKIEAELASEISVNELAKKAGYSLFYYYHIFQKEVEMPVMQYIIRRRLLHGIYEMSQGDKKIDIALISDICRFLQGICPGVFLHSCGIYCVGAGKKAASY